MSRMTKKTLEDAVQIVTEKVIVGTEWDDIENKEVQESTEKVEMMRGGLGLDHLEMLHQII